MYNKAQVLVLIYQTIMDKGLIYKSNIMSKYNITDRTFRRYMWDLEGLGLVLEKDKFGTEIVEISGQGIPVYEQRVRLVIPETNTSNV
jgi:predicted transcriptional regulator